MRLLVLLAVLSSSAAFAEHDAIIWTSETTAEAAAAQLARAPEALKTAGLTLPAGWPRVIQSGDVSGLKAGFHVVLIGYCPSSDTTRVLMRAKAAQRLAYVRKVTLTEPQAKDAQCPGIDPGIKPAPVPAYLVAETGKNKLQLEQRLEALKTQGMLELPDGFPRVVETKSLKIAVPPGKTADKLLLLLGVCEVTRAEVVLGGADLYSAWPAWALGEAPMACPKLSSKAVPKALQKAIELEDPDLVKELAERTSAPEERAAAINRASSGNRPQVLRALLAAFGKSPALATQALPRAFESWADKPDALARREQTVEALLEAGATVSPDALEQAIGRCDVKLTRLFIEKGAKPRAGSDLLSKTLYCSTTDEVDLLVEKGLIKLGGADDGQALVYAQPKLRAALLKGGASLDAKAKGGLSLLDLVVLFPQRDDPAKKQLTDFKPQLAQALAGDGAEKIGGWTPLALAAATGDAAKVKQQLGSGAKADEAVTLGTSPLGSVTPLALAIDAKSPEAAALLIEKGASVSAPSGLCCELREKDVGKPSVIGFRGEKGAHTYMDPFRRERVASEAPGRDWSPASSSYGPELFPVTITPLARAALLGQTATVKLLLDKGAAIDEGIPAAGLTPLMLAGQWKQTEVIDLLLQKGARVDAVDARGNCTLAHLAFGDADGPMIEKVLKKKKGLAQAKGLLTTAALFGTDAAVDVLIKAGAGKNGEGKAAVSALCSRGDDDRQGIFDALETAGYKSGQDWYGGCVQEGD